MVTCRCQEDPTLEKLTHRWSLFVALLGLSTGLYRYHKVFRSAYSWLLFEYCIFLISDQIYQIKRKVGFF
jgi:hypothetical protein